MNYVTFFLMGRYTEKQYVFRKYCSLICFDYEITDLKHVLLIFFMWSWQYCHIALDLFIPRFFVFQKSTEPFVVV